MPNYIEFFGICVDKTSSSMPILTFSDAYDDLIIYDANLYNKSITSYRNRIIVVISL